MALNLTWTFGFNYEIVNGVHALSDGTRHAVFYVAAHTGVIYDYALKEQTLLQGHCNPITAVAVSEDKKWIVTADVGEDSMMVIWDSFTGIPIKTFYMPHTHGVLALDLSPDALFIATLSACTNETTLKVNDQQEISIWEWTSENEQALYSTQVITNDIQHCIAFNPYDIRELVTNGSQRVIFWNWNTPRLEFYAPPFVQKEFCQVVGAFTRSLFIPNSKQAITATEDGDLILWDALKNNEKDKKDSEILKRPVDRRAVKIIRVSGGEGTHGIAISVLTDVEGYIVVGNVDGTVRFYDADFRIVAWYEALKSGPISSISFSSSSPESHDMDTTRFTVPNFIVGTTKSYIVGVDPETFHDYTGENKCGTLLVQGMDDEVHGLATYPKKNQIALASYSGALQVWDYDSKRLMRVRQFNALELVPQCLECSSNGSFMAIGFTNGALKLVDANTLDDLATFTYSSVRILKYYLKKMHLKN